MLDTAAGGLASLFAVCLSLLSITTALRFLARVKQQTNVGPDDCLIVVVWLLFIGLSAIGSYGMAHKWIGYPAPHDPEVLAAALPQLGLLYWIVNLFSILSIGLVRLSALFFYRRIFCTNKYRDSFNWASGFFICLVTLWTLAYIIEEIFICGTNVDLAWHNPHVCSSLSYPWLIGWGISSFVLDILVLMVPMPKIWSLHTTLKRKLSICTVFLIALAGVGASCARMVIFIKLWKNGSAANYEDPYETNTQHFYYVALEVGLCAIAVNLPSLWYFRTSVEPGKILRSVRSMVSLRSSHNSATKTLPTTQKISFANTSSNGSVSSHDRGLPTQRNKMER